MSLSDTAGGAPGTVRDPRERSSEPESEPEIDDSRPRLSNLMEVVMALAVSASLARGTLLDATTQQRLRFGAASEWVRELGGAMLTGVAIIGGIGIALEYARRRAPRTWGTGRVTWMFTLVFGVLNTAAGLLLQASVRLRLKGELPTREMIGQVARVYASQQFLGEFPWALIAAWAVAYMATSRTTAPAAGAARADLDARELTGRAFAAAVLGLAVAVRVMQAAGV